MEFAGSVYEPVFLKKEIDQAPRYRLGGDYVELDRVSFCLLFLSPLVMAIGALGTIAFTIKTGVSLVSYLWAQHALKNSQFNEKIQEVANPIIIENSKDLHIKTIKDIWSNYQSQYAKGEAAKAAIYIDCLQTKKIEIEAKYVLLRDLSLVLTLFHAALIPFVGIIIGVLVAEDLGAPSTSINYVDGKLEMDELTRIQFHIDKCEVALEQSGKNVKVAR